MPDYLLVTPELRELAAIHSTVKATDEADVIRKTIGELVANGTIETSDVHSAVVLRKSPTVKGNNMAGPSVSDISNTAGKALGGAGSPTVRVKRASERYSDRATPVVNKMTGQPLTIFGTSVETPSEKSYARIGAWAKHFLGANNSKLREWGCKQMELTDHEKDLLTELYTEGQWCGELKGGKWLDRGTVEDAGLTAKALLDDATSGGQTLVPYEFDTAIVSLPYLHSQILPLVDMRTCASSEVKTAKSGQVTVSWGTHEGTPVSLFNTDSLISEISADVNPVQAAIEWGKDFEADTPVADFGSFITNEFGSAMLKELDRVICLGSGSGEPEGFLTASGTISVNSDNGSGGPPTVNDYMKALFAIGLQYRDAANNPTFVSNDTTYQRRAAIKVGTSDQRLVFGMQPETYQTLEYPHRICNTITNAKLAFVCLKKYRLWRRAGFDVMLTDQGSTLVRSNKKLMLIRARYAGKLVDANACAVMADCQS